MSTVDPFVYPMIARSLALFALSVVAAAERRENDATLRLELTLTTRADACTATFRVARRTMSHPEAFMRAFAEMLDAYGLERQTKMFSHAVLFVSTASDCTVRFAKSLGAEWTRHVVDVDGDEVQCWFVLDFEWLGANGARDSRATFLRDTFGLFLDGLRAVMLFVHIQRARVDDVVYEAPPSTANASTVFVNCARRIGISDSTWAAIVRVVVGSIENRPFADRDGVSVYINGSLMPWRQARAMVDHLWTLDERFKSFGLPTLRQDLALDANPEHIVYFAPPREMTTTTYVRRVTIHFLNTAAKPADVVRSAFPLASVADAMKTTMTSDIPIRVSAELSTAGMFDALQILKRDDPMRFSSAEEKEFIETSDRIGRGVLAMLESPSSEVARDFCSQCDAEDENWRRKVLSNLRSSRVYAANCVEMK